MKTMWWLLIIAVIVALGLGGGYMKFGAGGKLGDD